MWISVSLDHPFHWFNSGKSCRNWKSQIWTCSCQNWFRSFIAQFSFPNQFIFYFDYLDWYWIREVIMVIWLPYDLGFNGVTSPFAFNWCPLWTPPDFLAIGPIRFKNIAKSSMNQKIFRFLCFQEFEATKYKIVVYIIYFYSILYDYII